MYKILVLSVLFFASGFGYVRADTTPWYWITIPNNAKAGYFIEGPKTIGNTTGSHEYVMVNGAYPAISLIRTPLPDSFMAIMEEAKDFNECSDSLDSALSQLRSFDSSNQLVSSYKSSEWPNEETAAKRVQLIKKIQSQTENCIEKEGVLQEKAEDKAREEREDRLANERRLKEIESAIKNCDLGYFEEKMTSRERKDTYKERMACKQGVATSTAPVNGGVNDAGHVNKRDALLKQIKNLMAMLAVLQTQLATQQGR